MKVCSQCGTEKALKEFYRDSRKADGHRAYCKVCGNKTHAKYVKTPDGKASKRRADRAYRLTPAGKQIKWISNAEYSRRYPKQYKAHTLVNNCVRDGRLLRPFVCECCGQVKKIFGHHENYDKPLDVAWLCQNAL